MFFLRKHLNFKDALTSQFPVPHHISATFPLIIPQLCSTEAGRILDKIELFMQNNAQDRALTPPSHPGVRRPEFPMPTDQCVTAD